MIPKVIHYCWFGKGRKSDLIIKCIASWKKYCPDYQIIEWNEDNYITNNIYFQQAYDAKKWAFAADYARLDIIYKNGGIYLDTDVELIKSLDELLNLSCYLGTESGVEEGNINTGLGFGAEPENKMVKAMLDEYEGITFNKDDGTFDMTPCPVRNTYAFKKNGYKKSNEIVYINGAKVFPDEYFAPKHYLTRELKITENTISIHHYDGAWMNIKSKFNLKIKERLGPNINRFLYKLRGVNIKEKN